MKGFGYFDSFEDLMETANAVGANDIVPDDVDEEMESGIERVAVPTLNDAYNMDEETIDVDPDDEPVGNDVNGFTAEGKAQGSAATINQPGEPKNKAIYGGMEEALELTEAFDADVVVDDTGMDRAREGKTANARNKVTVEFDPENPDLSDLPDFLNNIFGKKRATKKG